MVISSLLAGVSLIFTGCSVLVSLLQIAPKGNVRNYSEEFTVGSTVEWAIFTSIYTCKVTCKTDMVFHFLVGEGDK